MNARVCRTTCPYCGVGCGVLAEHDGQGGVKISGDPAHPANLGRLCVKGSALGETLDLKGRLLWPLVEGRRVSWEQALDTVAERLLATMQQHGPQSVAFYGSGQLLTEDYYVANKLMKGFIGVANMDTNSRLCMASAVIGYKRGLGADAVPCNYEDIELADVVVLVGSNTAWAHPVVYQRLVQAKQQRPQMQVVVIDPRRTATCDIADLHLPLQPGSDAGLFNGLLHWIAQDPRIDRAELAERFSGVEEALQSAQTWSVAQVAEFCRLDEADIECFYHLFSTSDKVVTLYSQGVNQSSSGSDKCNAIINAHLLSGKIGVSGSGPFSITGQPNAMGGREVGGLANQLASHMGFTPQDIGRVGRFWQSDNVATQPGLNAVDLFRAVERGDIKAVWIMGTNPVVSMPDADRVKQALERCPLVIVSEVMRHTDTAETADILLPALGWGEKDGTVTNSERRVSRQRAFLPAPGEAKANWWILSQVAQRMGFAEAFAYQHPAEIFREHAALSGFENNGSRAFDISGLATLSNQQWQQLEPIQWPVNATYPHGRARLGDDGRFWHADGKARLVAVTPSLPQSSWSAAYPLILNTGRIRDQWHTMTRTGKAARLMRHISEPYCELHPQDAQTHDIQAGDLVRLSSVHGWMLARARLDAGQARGSVFVPMHWNQQFSAQARADSLVAPITDPYSGQPESKHSRVRIQPWHTVWQATLFFADEPATAPLTLPAEHDVLPPPATYWSKVPHEGVTQYLFADRVPVDDWQAWLTEHYGLENMQCQVAQGNGVFHLIGWRDGRVVLACYVSAQALRIDSDAVRQAFITPPQLPHERHALLAGQAPQGQVKQGAMICSCYSVGEAIIVGAIRKGCHSVAALGGTLKCGTNCGSCIPELKALLSQHVSITVNELKKAG
ncbi:molybdopterin-dependent oxidoreductase [Pectobacterium polaris]|uniref:Molybdopterin-dependent oxidoreductase n=1 Tax=Pectobacterium polaris TaxID=2042057 RepID=A0AAW4P2L1_9GAMM|nr:nitrate reductase [Pectobacterium polaris]MBW5893567.1 molybdopterin-dependent oxidoreductase [Pectobacterium polaris]